MSKWKVYVRTEYFVLKNGNELATVRVDRSEPEGLFRKVTGVEVISLPKDTVFVRDPSIDVLNVPAVASVQEKYPGKTVVIEGMFSYMSFISGMRPLKLRAIDNIPPGPSRLRILVDKALSSGMIEHPIIPEFVDMDLEDKIKYVKTEAVMFPCRVSGLKAEMPYYFLDRAPEVKHDVTLIGCSLSNRIYQAIYDRDVPLINVCPVDAVPKDGTKTIVRCCTVKNGHEIDGNIAKVPWGTTVPEVIDAINALYADSE
ncbi:MAG: hypothetical protein FWC52_01475 [Candidatus Methanoplasma sp.]|uniref:DUF7714 family protein n=1 Tax=Candidatus Methanoplasma termitum TaxID=1577791 RepID=UPI0011DD34C5|nr:hypothetical protein [Candidatus Methanoplasma termitum]MCL2333443.1 hypothetical protein [Candidatus Methanoplasma sp.]